MLLIDGGRKGAEEGGMRKGTGGRCGGWGIAVGRIRQSARSPLCRQTDRAGNKFSLVCPQVAMQLQILVYVALAPQGGDLREMFCLKNEPLRAPHLEFFDSLAHVTTIFHCLLS